jgi:hypothetical protein
MPLCQPPLLLLLALLLLLLVQHQLVQACSLPAHCLPHRCPQA